MQGKEMIKNTRYFLEWCRTHVACDECGKLGGKPTITKFLKPRSRGTAQFVCADCARQFFRPN